MIEVRIPHPLRWLKNFFKAMLDPTWSPYDDEVRRLQSKLEKETGIRAGSKAPWLDSSSGQGSSKASAPGKGLGVGLPLMGYGPGGYSDTDDESYYGL